MNAPHCWYICIFCSHCGKEFKLDICLWLIVDNMHWAFKYCFCDVISAADNIPKADEIRTLVKDIWDTRMAKLRLSADSFISQQEAHAQVWSFVYVYGSEGQQKTSSACRHVDSKTRRWGLEVKSASLHCIDLSWFFRHQNIEETSFQQVSTGQTTIVNSDDWISNGLGLCFDGWQTNISI